MHTRPLGDILCEEKLITPAVLEAALEEQKTQGGRLGDILVAGGKVGMLPLYRAVAKHAELPFVDLIEQSPSEALLCGERLSDYIHLRAMPWRVENGATVVATCEPGPIVEAWAKRHYGEHCRLAVTSPYNIRCAIEKHFAATLGEESRLALYRMTPRMSARYTFSRWQGLFGFLSAAGVAASLYYAPLVLARWLLISLHLIYTANMIFKMVIFMLGFHRPQLCPPRDAPLPEEKTLPIYTVLVPLYREAGSLPRLLAALSRLDYPRSKLDIKLVLEEDDKKTIAAALALKPAWGAYDIIRVPRSKPRTKPKALNYALRFARGEYVTIFDAEDEPEPLQLKKAVSAFRSLPEDVGCLQAHLNYYNAFDNTLTRWFSLEYAILFEVHLPGLQTAGIPLPLGGTSNHFSVERLRAIGEWDPFNVTEDADLGVRLSARGLKTAVLDSITYEEAPVNFRIWMKQRSRWIKGYMQTWLVHMRNPFALYKALGHRGFWGFQCLMGMPAIVFLSAPVVWAFTLPAMVDYTLMKQLMLPPWLLGLGLWNLMLHFGLHWWQGLYALRRMPPSLQPPERFHRALKLFPFYWFLHSIASYRALWQLLIRPHFWEKTQHNMTKTLTSEPLKREALAAA